MMIEEVTSMGTSAYIQAKECWTTLNPGDAVTVDEMLELIGASKSEKQKVHVALSHLAKDGRAAKYKSERGMVYEKTDLQLIQPVDNREEAPAELRPEFRVSKLDEVNFDQIGFGMVKVVENLKSDLRTIHDKYKELTKEFNQKVQENSHLAQMLRECQQKLLEANEKLAKGGSSFSFSEIQKFREGLRKR
jgi:hypothetical protein